MPAPAEPGLLLVDDRPENLLALEAALDPLGRRLVKASSGEEALRHLLTDEFAVVVLDVQMPGMDGFETAEQIKRRDRTRDIPILFLTAINRDSAHRLRGFATGAVDYIFKPVEPELLRAKVAVFVELFLQKRLLDEQRARLEAELRERRVAEERLATKTAELARSNADLEQFCFIASHDLREPMRVVTGYLELLADRLGDALDDTGREWMTRAMATTERMAQLVNNLLAYGRAGAGAPEPEPVELDRALDVALEHLAPAIAEAGAGVRRAPLPTALARHGEVAQVLQNLVGNAVKFRGDEPPLVEVWAEHRGGEVTVAVRDNGRGVAEHQLERVFGMFERADAAPYPGTGLGLAVCRKLVERHGGRIWMERNDDAGVTVRFTLPAPS